MAIGGPLGANVDPNVRAVLEQLLAYANGSGNAATAILGNYYRLAEGPFPGTNSPICALVQKKTSTDWQTILAFRSDGTIVGQGSKTPAILSPLFNAPSSLITCTASYNSSTTTTATNAAFSIVNFNNKEWDTDSAVTTGASWKFTVPAGKSGLYYISAAVGLSTNVNTGAGTAFLLSIFTGGVRTRDGNRLTITSTGQTYETCVVNAALVLSAGQFFDIRGFQSSGAPQTYGGEGVSNWVSVYRIPGG